MPISAVILTANRRPLLQQCLQALAAGTRRPDEVVVVNNHSTDDTAEYLATAKFPFPLVVVPGPEGSFTEARNLGVRSATGDIVAFLDDDCEADRRWLERMAAALDAEGWGAAGGAVLPAPDFDVPEWWTPELNWTIGCSGPHFFGRLAGRLEVPTTSNMVFRRAIADEFPFREIARPKGSLTWNYEFSREDAEFWRLLRRAGRPVGVVPRAIVWHHVPADRLNWERARERARQDGRGFWNREAIREEVRPAVRDVVYTIPGAIEETVRRGTPLRQSLAHRIVWASRQAAFLEYAIDDRDRGIAPTTRAADYLRESATVAAILPKLFLRHGAVLAQRAVRQRLRPTLPSASNPPRRMLVVLHPMLGDAVLALPMLRQLAGAMPQTKLTLLTGDFAAPLLRANVGQLYDVVEVARPGRGPRAAEKLHHQVRAIAPDAILMAYCHGLNPLPFFVDPRIPVVGWPEDNGLRERLWGDLLTVRVEKNFRKHESAALLDLLAPFGIRTQVQRPRVLHSDRAAAQVTRILAKSDVAAGEYALLQAEAPGRFKDWPLERVLALGQWLRGRGIPVFLVGSRGGRIALEHHRAAAAGLVSLQGRDDSDELAALLAGARLFVGPDSGPAHVAQGVGTPSVLLFGSLETHRWGPLPPLDGEKADGPSAMVLAAAPGDWLVEEIRGLPADQALRLLPLERVVTAVTRLLEGPASGNPGGGAETN